MKAFSYVQKDGKTVTVDAKGRMRRTLPSGARDPEPIAGIVRPHKRVPEGTDTAVSRIARPLPAV